MMSEDNYDNEPENLDSLDLISQVGARGVGPSFGFLELD